MKVQASLRVARVNKGIFDSLEGFWADVNKHSSLHKEFVYSSSFPLNFKTIIALIWNNQGRSLGRTKINLRPKSCVRCLCVETHTEKRESIL